MNAHDLIKQVTEGADPREVLEAEAQDFKRGTKIEYTDMKGKKQTGVVKRVNKGRAGIFDLVLKDGTEIPGEKAKKI